MSYFVPRKPRHDSHGFEVEVGDPPDTVKAELVDLSREGFRLRVPFPPSKSESITMRVGALASGIRVTVRAVVRWRGPEEDGWWLVGCRSTQELDMETLGELFLNGVLVADGG